MTTTLQHLIDIDPSTGEYVQGWERIKISILTILQTRLKTRLMREKFGSEFLNIQDKPLSQEVWMDSIIAAAEAVNKFEPEFIIKNITIINADSSGEITVKVSGIDLIDQQNYYVSSVL